ncbi:MAG: hypothetical protein KDA55_09510, partial [Planctomycetales bacterium]|nr:hypothetical protein [Planctomycetales bacterium]
LTYRCCPFGVAIAAFLRVRGQWLTGSTRLLMLTHFDWRPFSLAAVRQIITRNYTQQGTNP